MGKAKVKAPSHIEEPAEDFTDLQREIAKALGRVMLHHPSWEVTRIISNASDVIKGAYHASPRGTSDGDLLRGLKALVPEEWELEGE